LRGGLALIVAPENPVQNQARQNHSHKPDPVFFLAVAGAGFVLSPLPIGRYGCSRPCLIHVFLVVRLSWASPTKHYRKIVSTKQLWMRDSRGEMLIISSSLQQNGSDYSKGERGGISDA
jgi:hypothetical protein